VKLACSGVCGSFSRMIQGLFRIPSYWKKSIGCTWSADATLPLITFIAAVAACVLTCSLHKSNDTLKRFVVVRGARRNVRFTPAQQTTNIGLRTSLSGPKSEMIAHDTKKRLAPRVIANSVALLELLGSDVMESNSCSA
jgi:hypothetical protein